MREKIIVQMPEAFPRRRLVLVAMALCVFTVTVDNTIMTVGLASIQQQLSASNAQLQWSIDAFTLAFASLLLATGLLGDRFGRRRVLIAGLLLFAAASLAGTWSTGPLALILWRAVMGIGAAVVPGCALAVIVDVFPQAERAKAIGAWSMAAGVGIGAGPVLGGALLGHFWWGSLLLVNVPITFVAVVIIVAVVPDNRVSGTGRLDVPGVLLSVVGFGLVVYGVIEGGDRSDWLGWPVVAPLVAGVAVLVLLGLVEGRMRDPSIDLALFRDRVFSIGTGILAVTFFVATGAAAFVVIFYVQLVRGLSPLESGLLMLPMAVGSMLAGMLGVRLLARYGPAVVLTTSSLLMAAGCLGYGVMGGHTSLWLFGVVHAVFGFGFGATFAAAMAVAASVVPPAKAGSGTALLNSIRQVGTALGVAVLGSVLTSEYRHRLGDAVAVLPPSVRGDAAASLGDTMRAVAANHPEQGARLLAQADGAFLDAMHTAVWVAAGASAAAAIAAARLAHRRRARGGAAGGGDASSSSVEPTTGTVAAGQSGAHGPGVRTALST